MLHPMACPIATNRYGPSFIAGQRQGRMASSSSLGGESLNAGRLGLFEKVNATPPAFVAEIVYQSADRSTAAEFVRNYLHEVSR